MTHTVTVGDRKITYELTRKKVKNINLRIKPDGTVHVSASTAVTIAVIERFIRERSDFILGAIDKFNAKNENRKTLFVSGEKLALLGTQHIPYVKKGIRNYATDSDGNITLYVTDTDDYELKYKTYITWLRSQCLPLMTLLRKAGYRFSHNKGQGYAFTLGKLYTVKEDTYVQRSSYGISSVGGGICRCTRVHTLSAGKSQRKVLCRACKVYA